MIKCALQYFLEIKSTQMLVLEERRKPSRRREENQQTQPTYDAQPGNRTRVGGECSDTAPTLLPQYWETCEISYV